MFFLPTSPKEAKAQLADWSAHVLKDKRDQPKVMYHGTNTKFFQFDKERISGMSANEFGKGFYFFTQQPTAQLWAESCVAKSGGDVVVLPVYLSLEKPRFVRSSDRGGETGWQGAECDGLIVVFDEKWDDRHNAENWVEVIVVDTNQVAGPVPAQYVAEDVFETTMRTIARHLQNQGDGYAASIPAAGCIATLEDGVVFSYTQYKDGTVDFENGMTPEIGAWDDLDPIFTAWAKEPVFIESPLKPWIARVSSWYPEANPREVLRVAKEQYVEHRGVLPTEPAPA
jgi:hypothetical protein